MKIAPIAINAAGDLVMSDSFLFHSRKFVNDIDGSTHLSNDEKHAAVIEDLKIIFGDIAKTALDIGIKIAVLWLKSQAEK